MLESWGFSGLSALLPAAAGGLWLIGLWPILRRSLHIYQQSSYQNPSYIKWLGAHRREILAPARLAALGLALAGFFAAPAALPPPLLALFPLLGGGLLAVQRRPAKAKKPLVFTPRVGRLAATAALLSALPCAAAVLWAGPLPALALLGLTAVGQPWLVMLYAAVNSPMERAVNARYIGQARRILRASPGLTVIGITGSYGKTSTKYFLNELLSVEYNVFITPGNYNTTLGVVRAVREGLRPTHDLFVCEMGARHAGDIAEICALVRPQIGMLTYIGPQHLETFGSQQAITDTKLELRDAVAARGGPMFVNWGSPIAAAQRYDGRLTRYGVADAADYRAHALSITDKGSAFTVTAPSGESAQFATRLLGAANVENITGAIAVAHSLGIALARLVPAVRTLKGAPHRLELKPADGMTLIDDAYNSNPLGAKNALETLQMCRGSRIVVTPGLVELGALESAENRALGATAAACADYVVTVGRHPGGLVAEGALAAGLAAGKLYQAAGIEDALAHVKALALPDKFVLLLNDLPDRFG